MTTKTTSPTTTRGLPPHPARLTREQVLEMPVPIPGREPRGLGMGSRADRRPRRRRR